MIARLYVIGRWILVGSLGYYCSHCVRLSGDIAARRRIFKVMLSLQRVWPLCRAASALLGCDLLVTLSVERCYIYRLER